MELTICSSNPTSLELLIFTHNFITADRFCGLPCFRTLEKSEKDLRFSELDVMKKIIVIGCPGSGKSTFSRKLEKVTNIPLYYLDMMNWNEDRTTVEKDIFQSRLDAVLKKDSWIIDGNYFSTMEKRMEECDTVFFLDYETEICLSGVMERKGKKRPDMPWIEIEDDEEFLDFIKKFGADSRPKILELLEKYKDKEIYVFKNRNEADSYLEKQILKTE